MSNTLVEILAAHRAGLSPVDTIRDVHARIAAWNDPALFITMRSCEEAVAIAQGLVDRGATDLPLFGAPFVVKDNIDVAGLPTTAGCPDFSYMPYRSAHVVERLERAGAIVIGKTNLDQFATGLVGVRSPIGTPRNALRADIIPGGSSSGSATAVGAGLVPFALGTDTAGSGRVPAALNAIAGLKPSLGLLSSRGVVPACRTLDTISIFALNADDAFAVLQCAAGYDPDDSFSRAFAAPQRAALPPVLRIGVPRKDQRPFFGDSLAEAAFIADLARVESIGAQFVEIDMAPFMAVAKLLYEGPWVAERYAAVRKVIETQPEAMLPLTRAIIGGATRFSAADAFEAIYRLADLRRETQPVWRRIDALAVPTIPALFTLADVAAEPLKRNAELGTWTNFVNLLDLSGFAVPAGLRADGFPSSLTFLAPSGADGLLASLASRVQHGSGVPMGRTGERAPAPGILPDRAGPGLIEIAVVGAHLSGMALNHELTTLGGTFLRKIRTAPDYRFYALPGTTPPKPGLLRVAKGEGVEIEAEVWALSPEGFGRFVAGIPSPLGIGTILDDAGFSVQGFLCEAEALKGATDISHFGGWRAFMASRR